ncbi:MAG: hypothetical protein QF536_10090, partial [Arenicellales bacterium]|nr:hypothetical protein [Arenicellales bacterium]
MTNPTEFNELLSDMSANEATLSETVPPVGGGEALPPEDMITEDTSTTTPVQAAQASMQSLVLADKDKNQSELEITARLLDQVREYHGFDNIQTRAKAGKNVTHSDLEKALQCSSHVALKHAEAYSTLALRKVEDLQENAATNAALNILKEEIQGLREQMKTIADKAVNSEGSIRALDEDMKIVKTDITEIRSMLEDVNTRIANLDTNIQLNEEQYKRLRSEIWASLSHKVLELAIDDHKRKLVIYGLENMGYNVQANNRAIYKKIIADANMRDQLPESCTLRVDFLGRRTNESQAVKQPAMVVTYNSEDLVYTGLKLKAALKANENYKRVFFH